MVPSIRRLFSAALLLTASGGLADPPPPGADAPAREVVTHTPTEAPNADEQLRALARAIESLNAEIQRLRALQAERAAQQFDREQNSLKLWP